MKTDIFIRTYHKDITWLTYALKSIHKYCKGFNEIIICIPESQKDALPKLTYERIVTCPDYPNDYLGQQVSKMLAFQWCKADNVMFTDSDCIFFKDTRPEDFMIDGKPWILKTPYNKVGDAICWKQPTEFALRGSRIDYEYMRRLPLLYKRSTLEAINKFLNGSENYIMSKNSFSEFNLIGAYADIYENSKYAFLNTDECKLPETHLKQFFSHDGIEKHIDEINKLIG